MSRGHTSIVDALVSSGALWPEEFDCVYGSCLGSLDYELEKFATRALYMDSTRSLPSKNENDAMTLRVRQDPGFIRTFMAKIGMPRVTAGRIRAVAELYLFNSVVTASQLKFFESNQRFLDRRITALQDEVLSANPRHRDPLQASLIKMAQSYHKDVDFECGLLIQALLNAGASVTISDSDSVHVPHFELVRAARRGSSTLRHALVENGVEAAVSSFDQLSKSFVGANLVHMIQNLKALEQYGRRRSRVYQICQILEAAVYSDDEALVGRLYGILMSLSPNSAPEDALYAAIDHGKLKVVELLCKGRADLSININARDYKGRTPLLFAVEQGAPVSMFHSLLSYGADPTLADEDGETVLYKAAASCDPEILDYLSGFKRGHVRFYLETVDLNNCVRRMNPVAWNNLIQAFQDKHPTAIERKKTSSSGNIRITHSSRSLDEPLSVARDHQGLFAEIVTTYEKARGKHLLQIPCQKVDGLFELSAVTFQDEIESPLFPLPLIHAEQPKTTKKLSQAAADLLERQASEDLLLKYGFGT